MHLALLATVPHTGTNWLLEFLRPHFEHVVQTTELVKTESYQRDASGVVLGLSMRGHDLVWGHVREREKQLMFALAAAGVPVIVPVRDPLLALCSTRNHFPAGDGDSWFFEAWKLWAAMDDWGPTYVPIDRMDGSDLDEVLVALHASDDVESIEAQLVSPPVNSQGDYPLRIHYDARNKHALRGALGAPLWERLLTMEPLLRPILERLGYRDLLWWTG